MKSTKKTFSIEDPRIGLRGYLVIDSVINGSSTGGIRMLPYVTREEIEDLARSMTAKHLFLNVPKGGARAGIVTPEGASRALKQKLLNVFAEHVAHIIRSKKYLPAPDMGTDYEMIRDMHAHIDSDLSRTSKASANSAYYTALSVFEAIRRSLEMKKKHIQGARCVIEGFGGVGSNLALLLHGAGAPVIAVSNAHGAIKSSDGLNVSQMITLRKRHGDNWMEYYTKELAHISQEDIFALSADVLCLCGRSYQVDAEVARRISAMVVSAGANNPVSKEADKVFFQRGIMYLPDYVSNSGGVLGNNMEFLGLGDKAIKKMFREVLGSKFSDLLHISQVARKSPGEIADEMIFKKSSEIGRGKRKNKKLFRLALFMFRNGLIPVVLARPFAYLYIKKMLNKDKKIYETLL